MLSIKLVFCAVAFTYFGGEDNKPNLIADMKRDCTAFYERYRKADSDRAAANAVFDLCQLHNQVWSDPRYSAIEQLRGLRSKLVFQLKAVQKDWRKKSPSSSLQQSSRSKADDGELSQRAALAAETQVSSLADSPGWLNPLLIALQYTPGPNQIAVHAGSFGGGDNGLELVALIEATIHPEHWDINGGPGHIHYYRPVMALIVRAGSAEHDQVSGLLQGLRELGR